MRLFLVVAFLLQIFLPAYSQNLDSLTRSVDSSNKAFQKINDNFQGVHDSLHKMETKMSQNQNSGNLDSFLAGMKERERGEKRQLYIRIGLGVAFLAIMIIGLARRRKKAQMVNKQ